MRCLEPFVKAGEVYPCGRCLPCKFVARRIWFHRVLLEASQHDYSSVVTLTYDEAALPSREELCPEHLRDWLKRIRRRSSERYQWRRLRFIACGEYGEESQRPHYHAILFGYPGCYFGRTGRQWTSGCGCDQCADLSESWSLGASSLGKLSRESAAYVAGYVTRKITGLSVGKNLVPFMRMSNRPGIGASAMHDVASTVLKFDLSIPSALGHGRAPLFLGRYLRKKLAEYCDVDRPQQEDDAFVRSVQAYAFARSCSVASVFRELNEGYNSQLSQREAIREKVL